MARAISGLSAATAGAAWGQRQGPAPPGALRRWGGPGKPASRCRPLDKSPRLAVHDTMGSRSAPRLSIGDGAPVPAMLILDELSVAGAKLSLPKAAPAMASSTTTTTAPMPDVMPLAVTQPVAQEVVGASTRKRPATCKARSGPRNATRKRCRETPGFDEQLRQDVERLAKLARWSKRKEDAPAPTAMAMTARAKLSKIPRLDKAAYYKAKARRQRRQQ